MEYIIETKNLVKKYKTNYAVNDVSIHVRRGDIYGIIGKNGAGKTSLMKLILGLTVPASGKIMLFGNENLNKSREKIGSLIEAPGLYKKCTAYENMERFCVLYGAEKSQIEPLLDRVGLTGMEGKKAGEFSLGMRQRLGIAIALIGHPEILILDEPIIGLDPAGIKVIRDIILSLNRDGVTFVISSHLLDELAKVVTTYGIMVDGHLVEEVTAQELIKRCGQFLKISTNDNTNALNVMKKEFPDIKASIMSNCIFLGNYLNQSANISKLLIGNGFAVSEIAVQEGSVEDYIIERLGV